MLHSFLLDFGEANYIREYFDSEASYWNDVYAGDDVQGLIYRLRHVTALEWISKLTLATHARILDAGCGAGLMAVDLARRGLHVEAIDPSQAMIDLTAKNAREAGVDGVHAHVADVYSMESPSESFDLVIGLGLIPWLPDVDRALGELVRVTKPDGYVLLTADNRHRLNHWLDPVLIPVLKPLRRRSRGILERTGLHIPRAISATFHDVRTLDDALRRAHMHKIRSTTLGFGPFSLFNRQVLSNKKGKEVHVALQRLADSGLPILNGMGSHYVVLAQKVALPFPGETDVHQNSSLGPEGAARRLEGAS
ncbi:MAG: class I SAM-dependent methyltransferase [Chloroflexota bacterium]